MPLLFSYGTLQERHVQLALFGRPLDGTVDAIVGFVRGRVAVLEDDTLNAALSHYENAVASGNPEDRINGTALQVTDAELAQADPTRRPPTTCGLR